MLRLLTDENFNHRIVRSLRLRLPDLDCIVAQQVGLTGFHDEQLLELAAIEGRVIITHDVKTMTAYANARLAQGLQMPGLIIVPHKLEFGRAVEDLELIIECVNDVDLKDRIYYLPL
jgi:predicted nuclease of predicted toxin-antitoxin system